MVRRVQGFWRISFAILIVCLLVPARSTAQNAEPQRTPGALTMGSSLGFGAAFPVVKDEPFTADVMMQDVTTTPDRKRTIHEAINIRMRDSSGRLRDEQLASPPDANGGFTKAGVHVIDPVSMQDIQWDEEEKTYVTAPIPPSVTASSSDPILDCANRASACGAGRPTCNESGNQVTYEGLGDRTIEGIHAEGCRITRTFSTKFASSPGDSSVTELWASPELKINLLTTERDSDGTVRLTRLTRISRNEPDPSLFRVPEGYKSPEQVRESINESLLNANPNNAKIWEYGRIEWHGGTARLVASGSRPLDLTALTLSTCLGGSVSSEDPHYRYLGELLDVTAREWAAQHPDDHVYSAKPGKVDVTFNVTSDGSPANLPRLLQDSADQVNQQQQFGYQVNVSGTRYRPIYSFVPTTSYNKKGVLEQIPAYLDQKVTIPRQTARVSFFVKLVTDALTAQTDQHFSCCQAMIAGNLVDPVITFQAVDKPTRAVLQDLFGEGSNYSGTCEPMDNRFCFINVQNDMHRIPETAPQSGVCTAFVFDGYPPGS